MRGLLSLPPGLLLLITLSARSSNATLPSAGLNSKADSWSQGFQVPRESFLETVLEGNVANQKSCKPTGLIHDACCDYQTVEDVNEDMAVRLAELIELPFFRYQKVDLFRECPFWQEDGSCMNRACAVQETEEDSIPEAWRSQTLGQVKQAVAPAETLEGALYKEEDFCVLDEDSPTSDGVYVDLHENPERFTGYAGHSANRVWKAIYEENCFDVVPFLPPSRSVESGGSGYVGSSLLQDKSKSMRSLVGNLGLQAPRDPPDEEQCLEKRVFYRLISGLHASISIHICAEYLDQSTGQWRPNLECFITRIAEHPERLQNVYFNYVLMLRALRKAAPFLRTYDYTTGEAKVDAKTKRLVTGLLDRAESCSATFDETSMFSGFEAQSLKEEFKAHFRNVSRIMDCVGCDKCRLWGKTQITGVATALKLLFSFDEANALQGQTTSLANSALSVQRSEIVAFIWTLHRFSESLAAVEQFRQMWAKRNETTALVDAEPAEEKVGNTREDPTSYVFVPEEPAEQKEEATEEEALRQVQTSMPQSSMTVPRSRESRNSTSSHPSPHDQTHSLGPLLHGLLGKLLATCRTSIAACLAFVERALAGITGMQSFTKFEL